MFNLSIICQGKAITTCLVIKPQAAQALVVRSYYFFFKKNLYANVQLVKRAIVT